MSNNLAQTKLELFYRMQVQKTIPEYVSIRKMKVHDRCASILSAKEGYGNRSYSYIRCNIPRNN